jgi:hypothetical protein
MKTKNLGVMKLRILVAVALALIASVPGQAAVRVTSGLVAIYDFGDDQGRSVKDRSGMEPLMNLRIKDTKSTRRVKGSLEVIGETGIESEQTAGKLYNAVQKTGAITIEAWVKSANTTQDGPARMVTLSRNTTLRNFTMGQEKNLFVVRFRTTKTSENGIPAISTPAGSAKTTVTHVLFTRDRGGRARIYLNGKRAVEKNIPGTVSNWVSNYRLGLGNELNGNRKWEGTYYLVAFYNRALSAAEVAQNFQAGAKALVNPAGQAVDVNAELFETKIAPLIAKHCLECHNPATRKGKLDLTRQATAFAGGENIMPGKSAASALWEAVAENEMPKKRPPLSADEKTALKKWIDGGAKWTLEQIDPAVYTRGGQSTQNWLRRLTVGEYIATVRAATGVDIAADAHALLPPDVRADGFRNTAYNLSVDLKHINAYAQLAGRIVQRMDGRKFVARFSRERNVTDKVMRPLVERMGKWLLRGPLSEREIVLYRGITTTVVASAGSFDEAVGRVIEAMLQSPRFIYRIENQQGDGTLWPVAGYELASRLSYLIWGAPPDEALFKAAANGALSEPAQLEAQVQRMLKDPRAVDRSVTFLSEWLNLDHLANLRPGKKSFPDWKPALATDMRAETVAFFKEIVWKQNRPLSDLLNAQVTFLTPRLAKHYRLPAVQPGQGLARYDLAQVPERGGLLTHGSLLTIGGDGASMVTRGLFVMHDLLRGVVKDPPPCVDTTPVPTKPGLTQRAIAEQRIASNKCGGCHGKFEPLAFGLEKFDGLGSFFDKDRHGNVLRDDGQILIPGTAKPVAYKTSGELMNLLAGSDRVRISITWKLSQFAAGRPLGARDARIVDKIHRATQKQGGTYPALITAIVLSDLVRTTPTETAK